MNLSPPRTRGGLFHWRVAFEGRREKRPDRFFVGDQASGSGRLTGE
jgi:hypothetical protein